MFKKYRGSLAVIALAVIASLAVNTYEAVFPETVNASREYAETSGDSGDDTVKTAPQVSAEAAILIDAETGEVLYEKNADEKMYPASTTKIMTALLTIEMMEKLNSPLDQKVAVPAEAAGIEGSSIYLEAGEEVRIIDLLYGMMLRSGNDAAQTLAIIMGGSVENFASLMNRRATEMGCTGTNFVNPSGLYDDNHFTTARDLSTISKISMKNGTFRELVSSKEYRAERSSDKYCYFYNKNKVVHQYDGGTGIKIGFTEKSGRTLVASAQREGRELICVVMNAPSWFNDAYALLDYGFAE